jgi:hypothetical protein
MDSPCCLLKKSNITSNEKLQWKYCQMNTSSSPVNSNKIGVNINKNGNFYKFIAICGNATLVLILTNIFCSKNL